MTRITDLAQFDRAMVFVREAQARTLDLQTQIGSGKKAQHYDGIARDTERLVSLETAYARVDQYVANNNIVSLRLQAMESSVSQLFDVASSFKALLVQGLNAGTASALNLNEQARQMLDQVASLLNVQQDGRYLFSGSRTSTAPVDPTALPVSYTVPTSDGDASSYYQGDQVQHTVRADDGFDVTYGVTADAPGFEKLIRALDVAVKGAPTDTAMLNHALDVVSQAIEEIPSIRTAIGLDQTLLDQISDRHEDFLLYTGQSIADIENVDLTEATARLSEAQTTLEASYLTVARLGQTTLVNFLR